MLNPRFIDDMAWSMAEVYGAVTDKILVNLAKYFPYVKKSGQIKGSFEYQARMLAQMGQINRETVDIIVKELGGADAALRAALEQSIIQALKDEDPKLRKAAERGILMPPVTPTVAPNMTRAFTTYYKQASDKLNLVNTVMLQSTQTVYQQTVSNAAQLIQRTQSILNVSAGEVITGVSSYNTAMRDAVRKMVDNGLTGFFDKAGHHWSPEAYVAMDIRTTMANTAREAVWEDNERYGNDLYQVSAHPGARPLCYPWQCKVVRRNGPPGITYDLDGNEIEVVAESDTSYGEPAGLFGRQYCRIKTSLTLLLRGVEATTVDAGNGVECFC